MLICDDLQCPRCAGYVIVKNNTNKATCWHCRVDLVRNKSLIDSIVGLYKNYQTTRNKCLVCKGKLIYDSDSGSKMCETCDYI